MIRMVIQVVQLVLVALQLVLAVEIRREVAVRASSRADRPCPRWCDAVVPRCTIVIRLARAQVAPSFEFQPVIELFDLGEVGGHLAARTSLPSERSRPQWARRAGCGPSLRPHAACCVVIVKRGRPVCRSEAVAALMPVHGRCIAPRRWELPPKERLVSSCCCCCSRVLQFVSSSVGGRRRRSMHVSTGGRRARSPVASIPAVELARQHRRCRSDGTTRCCVEVRSLDGGDWRRLGCCGAAAEGQGERLIDQSTDQSTDQVGSGKGASDGRAPGPTET
jgi:hypothetical protein